MTTPLWFTKAWAWLKRNWKWLIFPVGVLVYVIGRASSNKSTTVVSPELVGHQKVKEKLDAEAAQKKLDADEKAAAQLSEIAKDRSSTAASETQKQVDAVKAVQGNPEKVSDLLKQVGKDIRSGK